MSVQVGQFEQDEAASACVTFGVTWGKLLYSSASIFNDRQSGPTRTEIQAERAAGFEALCCARGNGPFTGPEDWT